MYVQLLCIVSGVLSTAAVIVSTFWNVWAISSPESAAVLGAIWSFKGLWGTCVQATGGHHNCREQASLLTEGAYINSIRAMMCIAMLLSFVACIIILFGMECSQLLGEKVGLKQKLMRISAVLFCITGTLVLASSAWYTTTIVNDFFSYKAEDNFIIFEIGPTLFLAYIASFLCFITTILCFCLPGPGPDRRGNKFKNFTFSLSREDKHFKKFTSGKRVEEYI